MATTKKTTKKSTKSKTKAKPKKTAAKKKPTPVKAKKNTPKKVVSTKKSSKTKAKRAVKENTISKTSEKSSSELREAASPKKRVAGSKVLTREFLQDLAAAVRKAVRPVIASLKGRDVVGTAPSGDATFELDRIAEKALLGFLTRARKPVAYYSEDSGYTTFTSGQPQNLLVVDPIDGTRAARSGFEGCVVSVCSTRVIERPAYADVDNALVMDILGNKTFYAERGKGARYYADGHTRKIKLSNNTDIESLVWSMTLPARPAELIFPVAAKIIDLSSLKGGFFGCNSSSFSLTRLITGQQDACVDFANRFYRDIPKIVEDRFINAGRGVVLGVCPYDFMAALLIVQEAGCTVTDAYGNDFDDVLLLDSSVSNHSTIIGAANAELHKKLLSYFDTRIGQLETLLKQRYVAKK